jgi:nucleoside-diphosphate-sugar epimerase/glycosyltransferase involved in cell wall biosynthesis
MPKGHQLRVLHAAVSMNPSLGMVKQMEWEQQAATTLGLPWKAVLHTPLKIDSSIVHTWGELPSFLFLRNFLLRKSFHQWMMQVEQDYDLIILRHSLQDMLEVQMASRLGHKLLTVHHSFEIPGLALNTLSAKVKAILEKWVVKNILKRSIGIVAVTDEILSNLRQCEASTLIKPGFVYPNGVGLTDELLKDQRSEVPELLLVPSYFSTWHELDLFIDAVKASNKKFIVHIVGALCSEDFSRYKLDDRFVLHGVLKTHQIRKLMSRSWCGLSYSASQRKGVTEACSLRVREYLSAGLAVYASHKDIGFPDTFDFFKTGPVVIDEILEFAQSVRSYSRQHVYEKAKPFISKTSLLTRFYAELEHQLVPAILGVGNRSLDQPKAVAVVNPRGLIAVTGASGFIGKRLVPSLLADGWRVRVLTRHPQKWSAHDSVEVYVGDLLTNSDWSAFLEGAGVLLHAAAEIRTPSLMWATNMEAPQKLFHAALLAGVKRWVQLSSVGAYGADVTGWIDEQTPEKPTSLYEKTKTLFDGYIRTASKNTGMQICIVRPSNVYGPQMSNKSLFQLFRAVRLGLFAYTGPTGSSANYVHVDDVVSALVLCASSPAAAGQTYNVSDWTTLENMVRSIAASLKMPPPSVRLPLCLAKLAARLLQWVPSWPLTLGRVRALSSRVRYATAKIEQELGWSVSKPVVQGVSELALQRQLRTAAPRLGKPSSGVWRLLIVSYDWPPRNSIATHRPYSWARYWAAQGIDVTVLTAGKKFFDLPLDLNLPELEGVTVVEADYKALIPMSNASQNNMPPFFTDLFKKAKSAVIYLLGWEFDVRANWASVANRMIAELGTDFDVVVSTYGPESAHKIAAKFKRANPNLFWVADYRDLWSLNTRNRSSKLVKAAVRRKELEVVCSADMFTTVSNELAEHLQTLVQVQASVIYNGFDIEIDPLLYQRPLHVRDGCLHIVYTGRIYPGKRSPVALVRAVESLIDSGRISPSQVSIEFYGVNANLIHAEIGPMKYPGLVKQQGYVSRDQALGLQQSADFLLLLESGDEDSKGFLTGKIFEYLAAGRPILSIGSKSDSAIARVLNQTRCGRCYENDSHAIANDLLDYLGGRIPIWFNPDLQAIQRYSRKHQAELMIQMIRAERRNTFLVA